jgi:spoIIIJ-associated protein
MSKDLVRVEANSILEAYKRASHIFDCSIVELDSKVIQRPKNSFWGIFKKPAVLEFQKLYSSSCKKYKSQDFSIRRLAVNRFFIKDISKITSKFYKKEPIVVKENTKPKVKSIDYNSISQKEIELFRDFFTTNSSGFVCEDIAKELKTLLDISCFSIEIKDLYLIDKSTIYIELNGDDAPLLIGKDGHRYSSFSYMLFHWIKEKYNLSLRLEIAQFLQKQEYYLERELTPFIENLYHYGYGKSKEFEGVMLHLALERVKKEFPNASIITKPKNSNKKSIVVNSLGERF